MQRVGSDNYRKSLGAIQWGAERVRSIAGETQRKILRLRDIDGFHQARRAAYGRFSSIIDQISPEIDWLGEARDTLRKLPSIDSSEPCIVVAGSPNVGKSALISSLSSGEPEIASYPFTTKQLHLGHFIHRRRKYQMVDTPGLLDRPMSERNNIEMQAIGCFGEYWRRTSISDRFNCQCNNISGRANESSRGSHRPNFREANNNSS